MSSYRQMLAAAAKQPANFTDKEYREAYDRALALIDGARDIVVITHSSHPISRKEAISLLKESCPGFGESVYTDAIDAARSKGSDGDST